MSTEVEKTGVFLRRDLTLVLTRGALAMEIQLGYCQALELSMALAGAVRDLLFANIERKEKEWTEAQLHLN